MEKIYTSVGVLTTKYEDILYGMAIAWVFQVSFDPLLVAVGVGKTRKTLDGIKKVGRFAVSLMPDEKEDVVLRFGSKVDNKFEGVSYEIVENMPLIDGAVEHIIADVVDTVETGDHVLVVGKVIYHKVHSGKPPILYGEGGLISIKDMTVKKF